MQNIIKYDSKIQNKKDIVKKPIIVKVNNFTEESAAQFSDDISEAHETDQPIIPVIIDSFGGQVYSLMSMISTIENSEKPISTICVGKAMSCGAVLLTCGQKGLRYADKNATILIHDVSSGGWGKIEDLKSSTQEAERLQKLIFEIMAKNCEKEKNYFLDIIHKKGHADWYISPREAKKHGIINHIKVPKIITTITVETTFK